jgi:site-specific recombinase
MNTVKEAKRCLDNARQILREKAHKEDGYYQDRKYVKMAGNTAYSGILVALDSLLEEKVKGRKDVNWYKAQLTRLDKSIFNSFVSAYDTLHLALGYDGNLNAKVALAGLEDAENIINWVEQRIATA